MSTHRKPGKNQRRINSLPNELLLEIFKYVQPTDLIQNLSLVSRRWRSLALDPAVWRDQSFHDADPLKVLYFAPSLRSVTISSSDSEGAYEALTHGHKDLKGLNVHFQNECFTVPQICELIRRFPNISLLDIQIPASSQEALIFSALNSLRRLDELRLAGVISDAQKLVEAVLLCESLTKLDLSECRLVLRDQHLARLFRDRAWLSLRLVTHFVTEDGYEVIGGCPGLRDLALVKCRNLAAGALEQLTALTDLRALTIKENCALYASALTDFFNTDAMENLRKVDFTVYRADDDVALAIATRCVHLVHLRLAMCLVSDRGVRDIVLHAANLAQLDLEFNNIRGDALPLIPTHLRNLAYLNLHLCYNVHIDLVQLAQAMPGLTIVDPTGFRFSAAAFAKDHTIPTIYTSHCPVARH